MADQEELALEAGDSESTESAETTETKETVETEETPEPAAPSVEDVERLRGALSGLEAKLSREREERIRLEERTKAQEKSAPPEPEYSRAQLKQLVDAGTISEEQRDAVLDKQDRAREERLINETTRKFQQQSAQSARNQRISSQIDTYKSSFPDVMVEGSETRQKVQREYDFLVSVEGGPRSDEQGAIMELKAMRAALGPAEKVRETTRQRRQTHAETGGAGDNTSRPVDMANKIPKKYREYYKHRVETGYFKGWDDPRIAKHLKHGYFKGWDDPRIAKHLKHMQADA
jgi:hypothetical protein